jgi:hypothetical protein
MFEHIDVKTNGKYSMVREKIFRYVEFGSEQFKGY